MTRIAAQSARTQGPQHFARRSANISPFRRGRRGRRPASKVAGVGTNPHRVVQSPGLRKMSTLHLPTDLIFMETGAGGAQRSCADLCHAAPLGPPLSHHWSSWGIG